MDSKNTEYWLRERILQLEEELIEERAAHNHTMDLLMAGEALREKTIYNAIINGAYTKLVMEAEQLDSKT